MKYIKEYFDNYNNGFTITCKNNDIVSAGDYVKLMINNTKEVDCFIYHILKLGEKIKKGYNIFNDINIETLEEGRQKISNKRTEDKDNFGIYPYLKQSNTLSFLRKMTPEEIENSELYPYVEMKKDANKYNL
jgi:hypothetical protein